MSQSHSASIVLTLVVPVTLDSQVFTGYARIILERVAPTVDHNCHGKKKLLTADGVKKLLTAKRNRSLLKEIPHCEKELLAAKRNRSRRKEITTYVT